jgi:WD40 repeat protein
MSAARSSLYLRWQGREDQAKNFLRSRTTVGQFSLAQRVAGKYGYEADLDIRNQGKRIASIRRDETSGFVHNAFTFVPDGRVVISGGGNGALSAHALDGSIQRPDFVGHFGDVWAVAVSPDARLLVSGGDDQTMRLWNLATRELVVTLFYAREGEWVMWTPQGYYASSPGGDALVGWHINRGPDKAADFVTARQLRQHFFVQISWMPQFDMPAPTRQSGWRARCPFALPN